MNDRRKWGERIRDLLRGKRERGEARVLPLRPLRRDSGPRVRPEGWHAPAGQAQLGPRCSRCGERVIIGSGLLIDGLCGVCRSRDEWPPAA